MDKHRHTERNNIKISLIIPAYNEESRIIPVLEAVTRSPLIDQVIVVDDGSADLTAEVARLYGVEVITYPDNRGKGSAMKTGIRLAKGDIIVFIDADLVGLTPKHLDTMIKPLLEDPDLVMVRGQFRGGRLRTDLAQTIAPAISGQRAVRKDFIASMPNLEKTGYGVEVAITKYSKQKQVKVKDVFLENLTHVIKEEKEGYAKGLTSRMRMYRDILVHLLPSKETLGLNLETILDPLKKKKSDKSQTKDKKRLKC